MFANDVLAGKVCLVTGGGTGIGRAIAIELLRVGAIVILAARNMARLEATRDELRAAFPSARVQALQMNIREEDSVKAAVGAVIAEHGAIHCLVNNGGGQFNSQARDIRLKGWKAVIDTNLNGTWLVTSTVYAMTPAPRCGLSIVCVTACGHNGFPGMAHTSAARAGVDNLTRTLASEWGPEGIRINSVAPGIILSSGIDTYPPQVQAVFLGSEAGVPLRRVGTESEVASAVVFLLSPSASYITGAVLRIDGGSSLNTFGVFPPKKRQMLPHYHATPELKEEFQRRYKAIQAAMSKL